MRSKNTETKPLNIFLDFMIQNLKEDCVKLSNLYNKMKMFRQVISSFISWVFLLKHRIVQVRHYPCIFFLFTKLEVNLKSKTWRILKEVGWYNFMTCLIKSVRSASTNQNHWNKFVECQRKLTFYSFLISMLPNRV